MADRNIGIMLNAEFSFAIKYNAIELMPKMNDVIISSKFCFCAFLNMLACSVWMAQTEPTIPLKLSKYKPASL